MSVVKVHCVDHGSAFIVHDFQRDVFRCKRLDRLKGLCGREVKAEDVERASELSCAGDLERDRLSRRGIEIVFTPKR